MGRTLEQLMADEKPEVVADARAMAADILLNIHLAELREKVQKTQVEWRRRWASGNLPLQAWKNQAVT
jgi:hypothetical protein